MHEPGRTLESAASLQSVLSTGELAARPSRPPDYETENRALLAIAEHMAASPGTTLQRLVEVALEGCRAGSAGVSLLSEDSGDFYWPAIAGAWKPHIGAGTPRNFGPCGVVLDSNAPQLFTHPERYYPYLAAVTPPIEEALLSPFYIDGELAGTVWVVAHDAARKFDKEDLRLIESLGRFAAAACRLRANLAENEHHSESLRNINEGLIVSSVRQHELVQEAEGALQESRYQLAAELAATQRLQEASLQLMREGEIESLYDQIIDAAVAIMRSEFASIQIFHPERGPGGELRLLSYRGFTQRAAKFWQWVRPSSESSCGIALREKKRVIVPDVQTFEGMAGSADEAIYLQTGIRSVVTTPLVTRSGRLLGMISTHWREPHQPLERDLRLLDVLTRMASDLIERSQADKALQSLNSDLKHFSYAASHDLQEPLRMVMSYTQLLARQYTGKLDAKADQFIGFAVEGAKRIEVLLKDLRDYWSVNEKPAEHLGLIDCNLVLEKSLIDLQVVIGESGAVITNDYLPTVIAEELPMRLLFQNLIGNAIKYSRPPEPPRIYLSAEQLYSPDGEAAWKISVTDNGIGIAPQYLQTIFDPFKRLHGQEYPGTGLGLAMCQRIVERYRGRIWAESTNGQGSTFHFTLFTQSNPVLDGGSGAE